MMISSSLKSQKVVYSTPVFFFSGMTGSKTRLLLVYSLQGLTWTGELE